MVTLFPHQEVAIEKALKGLQVEGRDGFSINDDMGLGKTITSIGLIKRLGCGATLCVVPKAVISHWEKEIYKVLGREETRVFYYGGTARTESLKKFMDKEAKFKFVLTTSATLVSDLNKLWRTYDLCTDIGALRSRFAPCHHLAWDVMVVDESHTLRNPTTQIFQAVANVKRTKTILLTGTPFNNTSMDMATQSYLLGMPVPSSCFTPGMFPRQLSSAVHRYDLRWGKDTEDFLKKPTSKRFSLVPCNGLLQGSFVTHGHVAGIEADHPHSVLENIEAIVGKILESDNRYRYTDGTLTDQGEKWITSVKEFIEGFEEVPVAESIKDIKMTHLKRKSALKEVIDLIFKFSGAEYYYEIVASDEADLWARIKKVLMRRSIVMQWRAFWVTGTENPRNPTFNTLSVELREAYCIRRSKTSVKEVSEKIPPMKVMNLGVELDDEAEAEHESWKAEFLDAWQRFNRERHMSGDHSKKLGRIMEILTRWRQTASDQTLTTMKDSGLRDKLVSRFKCGLVGVDVGEVLPSPSPKVAKILEYAKEAIAKGDKIIIFSGWTSLLMILREHLFEQDMPAIMIDGSQSLKVRNELVKEYQEGDCNVLLASIKACGVGLNLTVAQHAIFCEPSWNPFGEELQAMQRIHRIGQTRETHTVYLIAERKGGKQTIDHFVRSLQDSKMVAAQTILGDTYLDPTQLHRTKKFDGKGKLAKLASFIN